MLPYLVNDLHFSINLAEISFVEEDSLNDLEIIWKGKKGTGTWAADDKSQFCYTQTLWAGKECIMLKRNKKDGGHLHIFDGETRKLKDGVIEQGNKIK